MIPTARVQRGPSEAARCASKGIVPAIPTSFFSTRLDFHRLVYVMQRRLGDFTGPVAALCQDVVQV